jgi:hypothetical protein
MAKSVVLAFSEFATQLQPHFPLSARVDVLLFLLGLKPCMRTSVIEANLDIEPLKRWCQNYDLCFDIHENLIYFAYNKESLKQLITVDNSLEAHEKSLGELLGYPTCCCVRMAEIGENSIDEYESWLVSQPFKGKFKLINPSTYYWGKSFISHVPCRINCSASLEQAQRLLDFLLLHKQDPLFQSWIKNLDCRLRTHFIRSKLEK